MLRPHIALPDGYGDTMEQMSLRADALARDAMGLTFRERRILVDMADRLRIMANWPNPAPR